MIVLFAVSILLYNTIHYVIIHKRPVQSNKLWVDEIKQICFLTFITFFVL